jgi:hypothetical protein
MGKALLVIVLGSSVALAFQLFSTAEGEKRTARDTRGYQEEVIAREIAHSAFNVGMGELRSYGNQVLDGARALNGPANTGREGTYTTGRFAGGSYTLLAEPTSGHAARVVATGTFGDATVTMHDVHEVPVLEAPEGGILEVKFLESMAGYCSAIFYEAYTREMVEGEVPTPVMLFPLSNRERNFDPNDPDSKPIRRIQVAPATQMNFFIAVKKNCVPDERPICEQRAEAFDPDDYDHVHRAFNVEAGALDQADETIWARVEPHPTSPYRWRIGWEDLHRPEWDDADSDDPEQSFQALKKDGYDGLGWLPDPDSDYSLLDDFWLRDGKVNDGQSTSYRPDFSDQVVEVSLVPLSQAGDFIDLEEAEIAQQGTCGEPQDQAVIDPVTEEPAPPAPASLVPDDELTEYACDCTKDGKKDKYPILHRPPGNESNEKLKCLPNSARLNGHMRNHNDVLLSCTASRTIRANNSD